MIRYQIVGFGTDNKHVLTLDEPAHVAKAVGYLTPCQQQQAKASLTTQTRHSLVRDGMNTKHKLRHPADKDKVSEDLGLLR